MLFLSMKLHHLISIDLTTVTGNSVGCTAAARTGPRMRLGRIACRRSAAHCMARSA